MKEAIFNIIEELCQEKIKSNKYPAIVKDIDLQIAVKKKVLEVIRELWKEERIDLGRTVNNNFVQIRKPDSPPRNKKIILHHIPKV